MNADTERRLAAMIMEEANMMRQRAEKDGVGAYLAKPVVKARPNRQFLTAMVRGVQHANRIVDMEEMWRQRELENKASRDNKSSRRSRNNDYREEPSAERDRYAERRDSNGEAASPSSSPETLSNGLKDEDLEKFLHSKVKRGRGAVGSRMDEPGPYRARPEGPETYVRQEDWEERIARPAAGPSLPPELLDGLDSRRENKKHKKEKSSRVDSSDSDEERGRRRELKERKRKKEKRKSKDLEKHSKKKRKRH